MVLGQMLKKLRFVDRMRRFISVARLMKKFCRFVRAEMYRQIMGMSSIGSVNQTKLNLNTRRNHILRAAGSRLAIYGGGNLAFTHLKFDFGGYQYVLYMGHPSGIYVVKDGKLISNRTCNAGAEPINPRAFRGIETVMQIDGVDN